MTSKEERVRRELRRRAWDAAAAVYDALELTEPIEEVFSLDGGLEMVVTFRRAGAPAPPSCALGLEPVQRFLGCCWLDDLERGVIEELLAGRNGRQTGLLLRGGLEKRLGRNLGEGPLRQQLSRMTHADVAILDNDRGARPPGYAITADYLAFLAWAARAAPGSWAARLAA